MCYKNEYQKRAHGEVEQIFRELLPEAGLHVREEQIRLCHEMLDALMKNEITLCDAGVGIGKTNAYLTACILMRKYSVLHSGYSGCDRRSVVVSTSSIALQKAIIEEYVPFLSDVLLKADLLQGELKAVVRKGREHFVLCYCLGINGDTRKNADRIYNFKTGSVKTKCLHEGWQTSGSLKVVRMAFNLYCNSTPSVWDYEDAEEQVNECRQYTVEDIFCCVYAPYFWQAIQIRYPEYVVYNQKLHAMLGGID